MSEKRAYTMSEFLKIKGNTDHYNFNDREGVFTAVLDYKVWGKKRNLLSFYTLDDGRKILCNTWSNEDYLKVDEIPMGTKVRLTFKASGKGKIRLIEVCTVV